MKIQFGQEIHIFKGNQESFEDLIKFIRQNFYKVPTQFRLYYIDSDEDHVIISCQEDLKAITQDKNKLKIYVEPKQNCLLLSQIDLEKSQIIQLNDSFEIIQCQQQNISNNQEKQVQQQVNSQENSSILSSSISSKAEQLLEKYQQKEEEQIKDLVKTELSNQLPQIIENTKLLQKIQESPVSSKKTSSQIQKNSFNDKVKHHYVKCDGCGESPILGIRYKCSVCNDFDYCEKCEVKLEHPHPFIKIREPLSYVNNNQVKSAAEKSHSHNSQISNQQKNIPVQQRQIERFVFEDLQKQQQQKDQLVKVAKDNEKQQVEQVRKQLELKKQANQENKKEEQKSNAIFQPEIIEKAKKVKKLIGGEEDSYYQICLEMKDASIQAIVSAYFQQKESEEEKQIQNQKAQAQNPQKKLDQVDEQTKKKAQTISSILGGCESEYYDIINEFSFLTIDELILQIQEKNKSIQEKDKLYIQSIQLQKPQQQQPNNQNNIPKQKKLKRQYRPCHTEKAEDVANVIGGKAEDYYEISYQNFLKSVNDIVEMILDDSTLVERVSSYQ